MSYALENALTQWEEGERRVRDAPACSESSGLERAVGVVQDELRKRLGSTFLVGELADLYSLSTDWAEDLAQRSSAGTDTATVVDAAFGRYARGAADFAGGRKRLQGGD
ncbi:MAG: hypothetical protein WKF40_05190 [Thermoleophilaceae bacterium]